MNTAINSSVLPKKLSLADVEPNFLAQVFLPLLLNPAGLDDYRQALIGLLRQLTVEQAFDQTPFYRQLYGEQLPDEGDFENLPLVNRDQIQKAGIAMRAKYATFAFTSYTSGTTTGKPLMIDRSMQEQNYLSVFFSMINEHFRNPEQPRQHILSFPLLAHGQQLSIPSQAIQYPVNGSDEHGFIRGQRLLERSFNDAYEDQRITVVSGTLHRLKQFSAYLNAHDLRDLNRYIGSIRTTGQVLTPHMRTLLEEFWQATVEDTFSFTEAYFAATYCSHCDYYHFSPFGYHEVIALDSDTVISNGRGQLSITGLYPFNQMVPFIRYLTGDLVERSDTNCPYGKIGYKFLGRFGDSLDLTSQCGTNTVVGPVDVLSILETLPDIYRPLLKEDMPDFISPNEGAPCFQMRFEEQLPLLEIEVKFDPLFYPQRILELKTSIEQQLCKQVPDLEPELLEIRFARPGGFNCKHRAFL